MTYKEFAVLMAALSSNYRNFNLDTDNQMDFWYQMLKDLDYKLGNLAVKKLMMESPYPPTVADIRKSVSEVKTGNGITPGEAWEKVLNAIRRYGHHRTKEALESLDRLTRRAVECVGFNNICFSEKIGIERSHFVKMFEQLQERERKENMLPEEFKREMIETRERIASESIAMKQIASGEDGCIEGLVEKLNVNS